MRYTLLKAKPLCCNGFRGLHQQQQKNALQACYTDLNANPLRCKGFWSFNLLCNACNAFFPKLFTNAVKITFS